MIRPDYDLINDNTLYSSLSAAERFAAASIDKLRYSELRRRVLDFFTERRNVVAITMVKNEENYLLEWLAYHRLIGVDGFIVLDNDSTDSTPEMLTALHKAGVVCAAAWPTAHPYERQQVSGFAHAVRALQAANASEWAGFLDLDEYYVSRAHKTLTEALAHMPEIDALHLTWLFYGSSGLEKWERQPTIERFVQRAPDNHPKNWSGKPLARLSAITGHYHHPHSLKIAPEKTFAFPNGQPFVQDMMQRVGANVEPVTINKVQSLPLLCIHHYATRSREEFFAKTEKGRVNYTIKDMDTQINNYKRYFDAHNLNQETDEVLLPYVPAVKEEIERLKRLAGLEHIMA